MDYKTQYELAMSELDKAGIPAVGHDPRHRLTLLGRIKEAYRGECGDIVTGPDHRP